ncbi:MAG: FecR family protein, partial [Verrucomicrobiota bacterium]
QYIKNDRTFLIDSEIAANRSHLYVEIVGDWIEPIPLLAEPDKVRVAMIMGEAEWAPPEDSENFRLLVENEEIPIGSTLRVGSQGCIGLDIGARHAVCMIPGSVGVIKRDLSGPDDKIEIDLKKGAVFSHVNLKKLPTDFTVRTPNGIAAARGTDFVTVALPGVTDVWIQEGSVELFAPDASSVGTVSSTDGGAPKIIRYPAVADDLKRVEANSATLTAAATLIPQLNMQLPKLRAKQARGEELTEQEKAFFNSTNRMHYLVRVDLPGLPGSN